MRYPALTIAALTIREAARRRLLVALAVVSVVLVGLSAWGFDRLSRSTNLTSGEAIAAVPQALVLFMFMFSFVVALSASAIGSPAVASEIESGVLMTVVTRPIRRSEVLLGKLLGLAAVLGAYAVAVSILEMATVDWVSGYLPSNPVLVVVYIYAEGLLLLVLALLLSTRMSSLAAGVLGIALFGAAWLAGVVGSLGSSFNIPTLRTLGSIGHILLPTDGLWHGAIFALERPSVISIQLSNGHETNPFFVTSGPAWAYLLWVAVWFIVVLGAGLVSFQQREL
jgi:ABC-type transport system involved in multi-copper enzyme maturation permease subunit